MIPLTLSELADVVGGRLVQEGDGALRVDRVTIDSRAAEPGSLFVPLQGEHANGHDFIEDAVARGAQGYLLEAGRPLPAVAGAVVVDDPADALLGLGAWVRDEVRPTVVAITGSAGKTTTKDFVAAVLSTQRRVVANAGSYNNELGVPLTCCRLEHDTEVLVSEVGARGLGHIAALATVLRPDVAVVTTIGRSHLELLGDVETVARAKGELVDALAAGGGVAVLNADDRRVAALARRAPGKVVTYGRSAGATWRAERVRLDERACATFDAVAEGARIPVRLPVPGLHNVSNALAALATADACGVAVEDAAAGLTHAAVSRWRMELRDAPGGYAVLNDAYNANPESLRAALDTLAALPARRRAAALGAMAELGALEASAHAEAGARCAELGLDLLVTVGAAARPIADGARAAGFPGRLLMLPDVQAAAALLRAELAEGDAVLVKASRSQGLERLAAALLDAAPRDGGGTSA